MSASDIEKGSRWGTEIAAELADTSIGIICLTPENLTEPWILFEAGALSKYVDLASVCPFLFEVEPANLVGPLVQFQATRADRNDVLRLLQTINGCLKQDALSERQLEETFTIWWPSLEKRFKEIPPAQDQSESPERTDRDLLEEVLGLVRDQARVNSDTNHSQDFVRVTPIGISSTEAETKYIPAESFKRRFERVQAIRRLALLDHKDRQILTGFFVHERGKEDICAEFGISEDDLKALIAEAKEKFKT